MLSVTTIHHFNKRKAACLSNHLNGCLITNAVTSFHYLIPLSDLNLEFLALSYRAA
jgi:hypothetical protein